MFTVIDLMKVDKYLKRGAAVPIDADTIKLLVEAVKYYKEQSFHSKIPNYFGGKK